MRGRLGGMATCRTPIFGTDINLRKGSPHIRVGGLRTHEQRAGTQRFAPHTRGWTVLLIGKSSRMAAQSEITP